MEKGRVAPEIPCCRVAALARIPDTYGGRRRASGDFGGNVGDVSGAESP
jgi:hypothetical protein